MSLDRDVYSLTMVSSRDLTDPEVTTTSMCQRHQILEWRFPVLLTLFYTYLTTHCILFSASFCTQIFNIIPKPLRNNLFDIVLLGGLLVNTRKTSNLLCDPDGLLWFFSLNSVFLILKLIHLYCKIK